MIANSPYSLVAYDANKQVFPRAVKGRKIKVRLMVDGELRQNAGAGPGQRPDRRAYGGQTRAQASFSNSVNCYAPHFVVGRAKGSNDPSPLFLSTNCGVRACGRRHALRPGMPQTWIWYHGLLVFRPQAHLTMPVSHSRLQLNRKAWRRLGRVYGSGCASAGTPVLGVPAG
jgi:hypothetical protein